MMKPLKLRNINLMQMQMFIKAAEYESFVKAAQELHVSQSMVSKRIASLESETGLYLFAREKNRVSLTPAGKELLKSWSKTLTMIEASLEDAQKQQQSQGFIVTFGLGSSVNANKFLVRLIDNYRCAHPAFKPKVEMRSGFDLIRELSTGFFDIVFTPLFMQETINLHSELASKLVISCPHCVGMLTSNPLAHEETLTLQDLKHHSFVMPSIVEIPEYSNMLLSMCKSEGFTPEVSNYIDNESAITLNVSGDDVFVVDEYFYDMKNPNIVFRELLGPKSGILMVWKKDSEREVIDFVNYAQKHFAGEDN